MAKPTIKDVATRAGVSPATVSLVLNNRPVPITPVTRQKVHDAALELGYRLGRGAQAAGAMPAVIGLVVPDNDNAFFSIFSNLLTAEATAHGFDLILRNSDKSAARSIESLQMFVERHVDGIILAQSEFENPEETERCHAILSTLPLPVVLVDRLPESVAMESVVLDHVTGGYLAAEHLVQNGHKKIGFISGPMYLTSCRKRLEGHRSALIDGGIEPDPALVMEGELQLRGGIRALPYLLGKGCTALVAFNDMMCYGIYKELRNYGLQVPRDVSLVGFDDLFFSDIIDPPLTTVEQPLAAMAKAVIQRLETIIGGEKPLVKKHQVFRPNLKVRGSVHRLA